MKIKIRHIGLLIITAILAGCSSDVLVPDTLTGDGEKTPIEMAALLDVSNRVQTRATDKTFDTGDLLLAYFRHVTWNGGAQDARTSVVADRAPRLVTFKKVAGDMEAYSGADISPIGLNGASLGIVAAPESNTNQTSNLKVVEGGSEIDNLYWDDFSQSTDDGAKDLRTANHYLQTYYGYCYNGGTPTTTLTENTGELGWTIKTDQTATNAFQHSDLLWSAEQTPVRYAHATQNEGDDHGKMLIPYTHAMSKVTINVAIDKTKGFDNWAVGKWDNAKIDLLGMRISCKATAPTYTLDFEGATTSNINMRKGTPEDNKCKYDAIVVPSVLSVGNDLATITSIDGNKYTIPITENIVQTATSTNSGWGAELTTAKEEINNGTAQVKPETRATIGQGTGYQMKSGVNYVLNVTISKAGIKVIAMIKDWVNVEAEGVGQINFNADVRVLDKFNEITNDGAQFDLWRQEATTANNLETSRTNASYQDKATTVTFDNDNDDDATEDTWVCDPTIYWPDFTTSYYFRALAKYENGNYTSVGTEPFKAEQGTDLVWGTTSEHKGYESSGAEHSYGAGAAINPRTGNVPMTFEHALSKITVNLVTDAASSINLSGAKLALLYNYDKATLSLEDGSLSDLGYKNADHYSVKNLLAGNATGEGAKMSEYIVVPQDLTTYKEGEDIKERKSAITYYSFEELEEVNGKTYDRTTLTPVYYTEEECVAHNNELTGAKKIGDIKKAAVLYTYTWYQGGNSNNYLTDQTYFLPITQSDYDNKLLSDTKTRPAVYYTQKEIDDAKAAVNAEGYEKGSNTEAEKVASKTTSDIKEAAKTFTYTEYTTNKIHLPITQAEFSNLSDASKTKTPATYYETEAEVNAYNKTLPGAWTTYTIKEYAVNSNSKQATVDTPKDSSGPDNLIRLIITLNDGNSSTYTVDLAQCKDQQTNQKITTWERGKHYVYTITLNKEAISFRALIKNWEESYGQGDATLEW